LTHTVIGARVIKTSSHDGVSWVLRRQWSVVITLAFAAFAAHHFRNDVLVEIRVVISNAAMLISTMFALVNGGKVAAMLFCDSFDFHSYSKAAM